MYTKQQSSELRQRFWTAFGKYLAPISSASGDKVNWINYKTGIKLIHIKMDASGSDAYIGIEIADKIESEREKRFDHFLSLKRVFETTVAEKWVWKKHAFAADGKEVSSIYTRKENVNVLKESDWPEIISFLKPRIIALDHFWVEYKEVFDMII